MADTVAAKVFTIKNELGLHARVAAMLSREANRFKSEIFFEAGGAKADGKSLLSILTIACPKGSVVTIEAKGEDARDAVESLERLIENKFGED
jgi:Phosphotransferase System HPr (HPr) Family